MQLVCIMLVFVLVGPDSFCVVSFVNSIGIKYLKKNIRQFFAPSQMDNRKQCIAALCWELHIDEYCS